MLEWTAERSAPATEARARWLSERRAGLLLLLVLVALGGATPWSLLVTLPIVLAALTRRRRWDGIVLGAALILAGSLLGFAVTIDLPASITAMAGLVGAFAVTVLLVALWTTPRRLLGGLAGYLAIACLLVLLGTIQVDIQYAKLNAFSQAVYAWFARWPHLDNVGFSQNATAALIVAVCPFSLALALRRGRPLAQLVAAFATLWLLFALILTLSRGAFLGLSLGFGAMIWLHGGRTRWLAPLPTAATLVLLLAGVTGYEFTLSTTPTGFSSADRLYIWHTALRMLADFPLTGPGVGTFPARVAAYTWPMEARDIPHAHNFILQTYLDSGLLGLIGMVTLLLGFFFGTSHLLSQHPDARLRAAVLGSAGAMVATLAQGAVDAYFWGDPRTFYVVAFPIAALISAARLQGASLVFPERPALGARLAGWTTPLRTWRPHAWRRAPGTTLAVLALFTLALAGARPLASLALSNAGNLLREHGELLPAGSAGQALTFAVARQELLLSTSLETHYGAAWQDLAEVYLDDRNASQASLYLGVAAQEGQHDALVLRDDDRLSRLAIAQAASNPRIPH